MIRVWIERTVVHAVMVDTDDPAEAQLAASAAVDPTFGCTCGTRGDDPMLPSGAHMAGCAALAPRKKVVSDVADYGEWEITEVEASDRDRGSRR